MSKPNDKPAGASLSANTAQGLLQASERYLNTGNPAQAELLLRQVSAAKPDNPQAWFLLGIAQAAQEKRDEAVVSYEFAIQYKKDLYPAMGNLAGILYDSGRFSESEMWCRRALRIAPKESLLLNTLGNALRGLGKLDEAVASYTKALGIKPDYAEAYNNSGKVLRDLGQLEAAAMSYAQSLEINPVFAETHNNLGVALKDTGQFDSAIARFRRALEINPDFAAAHSNLGYALHDLGQFDEALSSYAKALEIEPDDAGVYNNLLFTLNYHPDKSGEEIFAMYRGYDERFGLPHRGKQQSHANSRNPLRRLKIGYVSPDFRRHPCQHFLEPLLACHDKNEVEVYAYAELFLKDEVTLRYQGYVDHWVPTPGMNNDKLSERIRSDGIDILVDLAGHTDKNRLSVFARKPAPVSLSWLGFGYTTGLTAVDYFLTDRAGTPPGSENLFSETPWRLETPAYAYRPAEGMGEVSPLPALTRGYVTFGTLTRAVRINHRTIRVWSEILKQVAGSRLIIDSGNFKHTFMQDTLVKKFAAHGITRERLEIGCHSPPWDILRSVDIGLDCFPHNSGTTLFETLYMGIPFITLAGRPSVGRLGSSILEGARHPEWIARSEDSYVETAAALAADLPKLAKLRDGLRHEMETGPLMDEAGFARKVEAAYREMFRKWAQG